jgi:hypothetical protein
MGSVRLTFEDSEIFKLIMSKNMTVLVGVRYPINAS